MPFQLQRPQILLSLLATMVALALPSAASAQSAAKASSVQRPSLAIDAPGTDVTASQQGPDLAVDASGTDVAAADQQAPSAGSRPVDPIPVSTVPDDGDSVINFWLAALIAFAGLALAYRVGAYRTRTRIVT